MDGLVSPPFRWLTRPDFTPFCILFFSPSGDFVTPVDSLACIASWEDGHIRLSLVARFFTYFSSAFRGFPPCSCVRTRCHSLRFILSGRPLLNSFCSFVPLFPLFCFHGRWKCRIHPTGHGPKRRRYDSCRRLDLDLTRLMARTVLLAHRDPQKGRYLVQLSGSNGQRIPHQSELGGYSPATRYYLAFNTNWVDLTLINRVGRSLNSCRMAFHSLQQQQQQSQQQPPHLPAPASTSMPRPDGPGTSASIDPSLRKRPLFTAEKPRAPRAIQPRPPASTASWSSESGASAQLSPRLPSSVAGEPPRKRGRPSKLETERRRAAAEARGETYPPPRRSGSDKIPPSPTSPASSGPQIAPYPHASTPQAVQGPSPGPMPFDPAPIRSIAPAPGFLSSDERRDIPSRSMGSNLRELPQPAEMRHHLPSPHTLQLGPPDPFNRLNSNSGERGSYSSIPPDRLSPDSGRRDSVASRGEPPPGPFSEGRVSIPPGEKPTR